MQRNRIFATLAFGFVLLAVPISSLGVAWPSIAEDLGRALSQLGLVTFVFGAGYTASTMVSGRIARTVATGRLLIVAAALSASGLTVISLSEQWGVFLVAVALIGCTGGIVDAATNTYVAIRRGVRAMGLIHATFGIGTIFGPLLVTLLLAAGASWRIAFAALAVAQLVSLSALLLFARRLDVRGEEGGAEEATVVAPIRSPVLLWSLVVFLLYSGVAAGTGAWAYTFLTEARGVAEGAAGLVVTGYWTAFTISRLVLTAAGDRLHPNTAIAASGVATVGCLAVFWWTPFPTMGLVALMVTGFAHGPIFPLEVLLTPRRFGARQTAAVVGYEIAAANVGGAIIPGLIGILVGAVGLDVVPPFLFVNALLLWGALHLLRRASDATPSPAVRTPAPPAA